MCALRLGLWLGSEGWNCTALPLCLTSHQCALGFAPRQPQAGALGLERKKAWLLIHAEEAAFGPERGPSSGVAASRPELRHFIFASTLVTTCTSSHLSLPKSNAAHVRAEGNHTSVFLLDLSQLPWMP